MGTLETVQQITSNASVGASESQQLITMIFGILVAGAGAAMWVRTKLSKDGLGIKKDAAEADLMKHLEDERDVLKDDKEKLLARLLQIDAEKNEAVNQVGKLSVEVEHLTKQVKKLEELVEMLGNKLDHATAAMQTYQVENIKLSEKMGSINELFAMKCDACSYKKEHEVKFSN